MKKILFLSLIFFLALACDKRAEHILTSGKMESVLYDYHMAQGMLEQLSAEERDKMSQAYIDAVFEKNGITEEDFDSSMVYYNRHADELQKIYKSIESRLTEENQALSISTGNSEMMSIFDQKGDTSNIWNAPTLSVLRSKEGSNYETFNLPADSSFYREDRFVFVCNPIILRENASDHNSYVVIGLTVNYKDGKCSSRSIKNSDTRKVQLDITAEAGKDVASVAGYYYYNSKDNFRNLAVISDIALVRMHKATVNLDGQNTNTQNSDSLKKDTVIEAPRERLTPEQIRQMNQSDNRINIKAAPDVRTPNSIGPRRRPRRR